MGTQSEDLSTHHPPLTFISLLLVVVGGGGVRGLLLGSHGPAPFTFLSIDGAGPEPRRIESSR